MHVNDLLKIAVEQRRVRPAPEGRQLPDDARPRRADAGQPRTSGSITRTSSRWAPRSCPTTQRQKFKDAQEVDLAYSVPGLGRFRCNIFQQRGTVGLVLRVIPMQIRTIDELGLPPVLKRIAEEERGLVLVTGTTGSGKSTTLAAMIDYINQTRCGARHDGRGSDRVPAPRQQVDRQPARGLGRHALVRAGAAQRPAPGSGRHPGRRNARLRDDRNRPARRRNRPPRVLDPAHARRHRDDQPHHLGVSAAPAEADPPAARQRAQGGGLAAPDAARRRQRPRAGGRSADQHRRSSATASSTRKRRT